MNVERVEYFLNTVLGVSTSKCRIYFIDNADDEIDVEAHFLRHVNEYIRKDPQAAAAWAAWIGSDDAAAIELLRPEI